jgi:hypothetical protein
MQAQLEKVKPRLQSSRLSHLMLRSLTCIQLLRAIVLYCLAFIYELTNCTFVGWHSYSALRTNECTYPNSWAAKACWVNTCNIRDPIRILLLPSGAPYDHIGIMLNDDSYTYLLMQEIIACSDYDHSARWLAATQLKNCIRNWRGRPGNG